MGLMSNNNPYYGGNAFAEAINQGIDGWNTQAKMGMMRRREDADLANQKLAMDFAKQKALQDELGAGQKMDERLMYQKAQGELQARLAPRPLVDEYGTPTDLGEGLMPPEFKEQYRGPYADPSQAVQRVSNPAWGETLGAMQERKEVPALPLSTPELASFGVRMGDKNILEKLIPKENTNRMDLLKSGKYDPDSIDPFLSGTGKLKFASNDDAKFKPEMQITRVANGITYGVPTAFDERTGKSTPTGPERAIKAKEAGTSLNFGDRADLYEKKAAFGELPKLRQDANASLQVLPKLTRMQGILEGGNSGDSVAYLRQYLAPYAPESKSANEAQLFQILARTISGPQRINIIGPGAQTEKEGDILRQIGGGGNQGRAALRELLNIHITGNKAKIDEYNGMREAAGTKIYPAVTYGDTPKQPAVASGPKKGDVVKGYMFMGGDPANKKNWGKR